MPRWITRPLVLLVPLALIVALGALQGRRQFAYLNGDGPGAPLALRGTAVGVVEGELLRVTVIDDGVSAELLIPAHPAAAQQVAGVLRLAGEGGVALGVLTLDVEEAGRYVSGRISAEIAGRRYSGGLRVRAQSRPTSAAPGLLTTAGR